MRVQTRLLKAMSICDQRVNINKNRHITCLIQNIFILAVPFFLMVATFDIISLVGLGTSLFDKVLSGSQVRDRERKGVCLPSKKLPCFEQAAQVFSNVIHMAGYGIFISTLFFGWYLRNQEERFIALIDLCKSTEPQSNCTATTAKTTTKNVGVECVCNDYA